MVVKVGKEDGPGECRRKIEPKMFLHHEYA